MSKSESNPQDIQASLSHIERLLQRGNQLLYGSETRRRNGSEQVSESEGVSPLESFAGRINRAGSRRSQIAVNDSESDSASEDERVYEEREIFFKKDARRVAKLIKESRRVRLANAAHKAAQLAEEGKGVAKVVSRRKRAQEEEEEEEPPESVDLSAVCARIHHEVEEYRTLSKNDENWFFKSSLSNSPKKYVSPYTSTPSKQQMSWKKPKEPSVRSPQKPQRRPTLSKSNVSPASSAPIPRKPREETNRNLPVWQRLYPGSSTHTGTNTNAKKPFSKPLQPLHSAVNRATLKKTSLPQSSVSKAASRSLPPQPAKNRTVVNSIPAFGRREGSETQGRYGAVQRGQNLQQRKPLYQGNREKVTTPLPRRGHALGVSPLEIGKLI